MLHSFHSPVMQAHLLLHDGPLVYQHKVCFLGHTLWLFCLYLRSKPCHPVLPRKVFHLKKVVQCFPWIHELSFQFQRPIGLNNYLSIQCMQLYLYHLFLCKLQHSKYKFWLLYALYILYLIYLYFLILEQFR